MTAQARVREDLEPNGCDWIFALRASGVRALADQGALQPTLFDEQDMAEIECRELFGGDQLVVCRNPLPAEERTRKRKDLIAAAAQDLIEIRRAERVLKKRKMRKHFDLKIGTGSFSWKRKKRNIADEAALDGFCAVRTNVQEKRMSAAAVETCKRLGRVERAFRTMKAHELGRGRPRLPGTARAARNAYDEPDRALGAGKAGIRRPRLVDADPSEGAAAAEREDPHAAAPVPRRALDGPPASVVSRAGASANPR